MPYQCCVYGCSSNSATNKNLTFHAFPSGERGLEWRQRIRNSKSDAKHSKICSRHFKEEDYHTNVEVLYKWEEKDDFKLVDLVQENRNLYDNNQSDYRDLVKVAHTWKMIGKLMGKPADICQNRFANLYNQFCGALKYKSYSHINSDNFYLTKLLKKMMFLWDYLYEDLDSSGSESKEASLNLQSSTNENETVSSLLCENSVNPSPKENNKSKINSPANYSQLMKNAGSLQSKRNMDPTQLKRNPATVHTVKIIAPIQAVRNSVFSQTGKNAATIHAAKYKGNTPVVRGTFHARRKIRRMLTAKNAAHQEESDTESSQEVSDEDVSREESAFKKVHLRKIFRRSFSDDPSQKETSAHFSKEKSYINPSCKEKNNNYFPKRSAVLSKIEEKAEPPKKAIILDLFQKEINACPSQETNLTDNFLDESSVDSPEAVNSPFQEENSIDPSEEENRVNPSQEENGEDPHQEDTGLNISEKVNYVNLSEVKHSVDYFQDSLMDCTEKESESDHFKDLINGRNPTSEKCDSELISNMQTTNEKNCDESAMSNEVFLHLVKEYMEKIEDKEKLSDLQFRVLCLLYNEGS